MKQHPEFHVMNMNLGRTYAQLAKEYLKFDDLQDAENAIESIHRIMPKLTPEERAELSVTYTGLRKELNDKMEKRK